LWAGLFVFTIGSASNRRSLPIQLRSQTEELDKKLKGKMHYFVIPRRIAFITFLSALLLTLPARAQSAHAEMPDAPLPAGQQEQAGASSTDSQQPQPQKSQQEQAAEDLKKEEKQRIMGIIPDFNMMDNASAPPLSPKQKFHLFWKSSTDPYIFFTAAIDAGISQAEGDYKGYGQGFQGYMKRFGASYADTFDGNLWGNAILPSLWHEDPRYFRKGSGSITHRIVHAALSTVWCRRDDGTWGPNYANVAGNIIAGSISNVYYPSTDRGAGLTFDRAFTVTVEGAIGAQLIEFWPDIERKFLHKKEPQSEASDQPEENSSKN
jgi:hypothetical protein